LFTKFEANKKKNTPLQTQIMADLVLEPLNNLFEEENGRLKTENKILMERGICKQELVDEYKAKSKSAEEEIQRAKDDSQRSKEEIQRAKDEIQQLRDEVSSLKEKEIRLTVENDFLKRIDEQLRSENEYLKRRDEDLRAERTAERAMFQTMISGLINGGTEDRKRKRNDEEATK
jgi:FtsZ-binding cell division protein ZapB